MTESQITIIIALIGLIITVIINISRFAGAVTKIETSLNHLNDVLKDLKNEFKESREEMAMKRKRLWDHNEKQDKILDEHELRIIKLENKEGH
ncbi:hypothetical protein [Anaerofustis sp. NSJ-163]|uniref:hypothetical protein n=1 Tax=Anaerofustis sp. NSJ-163 TaxID=2944391 RepID=UPI00209C18C4|nr:hypothetical protein [Anaerofustis sp. NSJ-163]MCO8192999.1 hypothetical protein [Anaerofustis sp. NSJ-163]